MCAAALKRWRSSYLQRTADRVCERLCYERTRADLLLRICALLFNYPIITALDAVSGQLASHFIYSCIHLQGQHTLIDISETGPG